jgi:16S rRNA (cytosine967-C5)-methyltransferase
MTPGARTQAAIELLTDILTSWQSDKRFPADKQLERYFKARRYIGSKDRGAISELIYWVLRHQSTLTWWIEQQYHICTPRLFVFATLILRKEYTIESLSGLSHDGKYAPSPLTADEIRLCMALVGKPLEHKDMPPHVRLNYPAWTHDMLKKSFGKEFEHALRAMNEQAPTDLRVNILKTTREQLMQDLKKEGFDVAPTTTSPVGLRMAKRAPIFTSQYFKQGHFEVQDEGSQMVASLVDAAPGQKVIDFCAGAGGKALAIAAQMKNKGRILAWDTSEKRLKQISPRLRRAGVDNIQTHVIASENDAFIKRHKQSADRVLVDAPCSGSGTWRRNPDLKWRFTEKDLHEVMEIQHAILMSAARLVKPGGRLIYATCSIFKCENEEQIDRLLKDVNNFRVVCAEKIWDKSTSDNKAHEVSYLWVTPHQDGVDGFFAAVLERLS